MYKTKRFQSIENYAMLDLEVAYKSLLEALKKEIVSKCDIKENEIILSLKNRDFNKLFLDLLESIEKKNFSYDWLIESLIKFEKILENEEICKKNF